MSRLFRDGGYGGCNDGDLVHFWKVVPKDTSLDLLFFACCMDFFGWICWDGKMGGNCSMAWSLSAISCVG